MKQMLEKLAALERQIAGEKGDLDLFALLLRADAEDKWDLMISAAWLETDKKESLAYVADKIRAQLTTQELLLLSRIVFLEKGNPVLKTLHGMVQVQHGMVEVNDSIVFGVPIKHAYLITSTQENPDMAAAPQST